MSRSLNRIVVAAVVGCYGFALAGCGSEAEAPSSSSSSAASGVAAVSENPSASVIGGPKPASPTTSVADEATGQTECGKTPGPDGALRILILAGDLTCDTAEQIAAEYGPMIATGRPQTVSGWDCGPSETPGVLATCSKDGQEFGLAP
ncbi:hypothetical protein [Gordonia rhizosphera]|uniref:Lipoprotein n=1 Tax=Gordonia rhizosphera NBRC 16068 TaxID=1108045 RepID=K6VZJ0_9ACTN|nr:hypothetical protein [Gordonia rhizosphera]GAB92305.1 hypothetical protein GORHZ_169_00510 [Gordonia rhizosphera NBRC 16068]